MVPAHLALSVSARSSHGLAFTLIPPATGESRCCSIRPPLAQAEVTKLQLGEHSSSSIITDRMHTRWRSASNSGMVQAFCRQARCCNSSCSTRLRAAHGNETRLSISSGVGASYHDSLVSRGPAPTNATRCRTRSGLILFFSCIPRNASRYWIRTRLELCRGLQRAHLFPSRAVGNSPVLACGGTSE
jgi:hypothetical protein